MKLLTKEIESKIPKLYGTEEITTREKKIAVKFFLTCSDWSWYAVEYDPEKKIFYGLVHGFEKEWGYFSLEELESEKNNLGLGVERDTHFENHTIGEVMDGVVS